jgi:integrase
MKTARTPKETEFPVTITERGVSVRIYRSSQEKSGKTYVSYFLVWPSPEGRKRKAFADFTEARNEAGRVLADIISGRNASTVVTAGDAELLAQARRRADRLGKPLLALLDELQAAQDVLRGRASVLDAVRAWDRVQGSVQPLSVADAAAAFLRHKEGAKLSAPHLKDLKIRLGKFVEAFRGHVHEIDRTAVREWLDAASKSPRDRNNRLAIVGTFLRWCAERNHIAAESAVDAVRIARARATGKDDVEIYTPDELRRIFFGTEGVGPLREDLVPFVALGVFAGIRPDGEMQRLTWENVRIGERLIEIKGAKAKTASRRIIPMNDTLVSWLAPYARESGTVAPFGKLGQALRRRCEAVGVVFKRNALRHSYGSYRLAVIKNVNELALEMGNSPRMVFAHYRELVTPTAAADFWSITRPAEGNVIAIGQAV